MAVPTRALVHRRVDGWLLGGVGVVAWLLLSPAVMGTHLPPISGWVSGAFLVVVSAHFGASYHLAYGNGWADVRRHPLALGVVPAIGVAVAVATIGVHLAGNDRLAAETVRALFVGVFTLTGWHYVKQAYGVTMLSARSHGLRPSKAESMVWRYGLYPIWLYDVLRVYGVGRSASYRQIDISTPLVPVAAQPWIRGFAVACLVVAAVSMLRVALRIRTVPPLGLWGAYAAGALWFLVPPGYLSAAVVLPGLHAIQYLTCVHRAEVDWAVERGERQLPSLWLSIFGGAAAGGLLASTWLPSLLDNRLATPGVPGLFGSLVFVFLNLHHYTIDATIWRSGGEHVKRISKGPALVPAAEPVERLAPRPVLA